MRYFALGTLYEAHHAICKLKDSITDATGNRLSDTSFSRHASKSIAAQVDQVR